MPRDPYIGNSENARLRYTGRLVIYWTDVQRGDPEIGDIQSNKKDADRTWRQDEEGGPLPAQDYAELQARFPGMPGPENGQGKTSPLFFFLKTTSKGCQRFTESSV